MNPISPTPMSLLAGVGVALAEVQPPPFRFTPMTWGAFLLANAIILAIIGPRLVRDLRRQ